MAIGCQGGRKAGIPGEDAQGVLTGIDSYTRLTATKAQSFRRTVVIGGGNVAIDVARSAVRAGSSGGFHVLLRKPRHYAGGGR